MERTAEPLECHVTFVLRQKRKKTKVSDAAVRGVFKKDALRNFENSQKLPMPESFF